MGKNDSEWEELKKRGAELITEFKKENKDLGKKFESFFKEVIKYYKSKFNDKDDDPENEAVLNSKDNIGNLALLDAGTNRGYGNALFPTKRQEIIQREQNGIFIPICTKNLFMKYYATEDTETSQVLPTWTNNDAKAYLNAIHETIDWIFTNEK